jgi:hypothetical protein
LGNGIDTRTNVSTNRSCFINQDDPNNIVMADPVGIINFDSSMATEDISKKLGFELSGKAAFIWAYGELSAKYLKDSSTTRWRRAHACRDICYHCGYKTLKISI